MTQKAVDEYPERPIYFYQRRGERIRYSAFKTRCPNCGKVCVEDFLADRGEMIKLSTLLNCHRCGHNSHEDRYPPLLWKKDV